MAGIGCQIGLSRARSLRVTLQSANDFPAALIVAKVTRDRIMREYHKEFPAYGFDHHFGYPTEAHRRIIQKIGPCSID